MSEGLFRNAHEALLFAFRFAHDQSPRTPMQQRLQGGNIGSGKGLVGIDGAGQAGMILAALQHLPDEQRNVITVRYDDVRRQCKGCGGDIPTAGWLMARDALSHCDELGDLPRQIRLAAVEKILCRRGGISLAWYASQYSIAERTLRQRVADARVRLSKVETLALAWLDSHFEGRELIVAA